MCNPTIIKSFKDISQEILNSVRLKTGKLFILIIVDGWNQKYFTNIFQTHSTYLLLKEVNNCQLYSFVDNH